MVDSYSTISLARATGLSLNDSLEFSTGTISPEGNRDISQDTRSHILELANTLQDILGEALDTAKAMFPHKAAPPPTRGTLPRHLWPNSVRHDVAEIRRRAKAVRRLIRKVTNPPTTTTEEQFPSHSHLEPWGVASTPLQLRTTLSPLPRGLSSLGVLTREALQEGTEVPPDQAIQDCFKGLRKVVILLLKHARNVRRAKYGTSLLKMFVKKPNMALKSLLRTAAGCVTSNTLPTDLSIIKDEDTGMLTTEPSEVVMKIATMETKALSPDPTLPPGAPFPWRHQVRETPASSVPMIIGHITPSIMQEALRRTPNHKAAGPDGVPGLVLKHMPPAFHEVLHLLF